MTLNDTRVRCRVPLLLRLSGAGYESYESYAATLQPVVEDVLRVSTPLGVIGASPPPPPSPRPSSPPLGAFDGSSSL